MTAVLLDVARTEVLAMTQQPEINPIADYKRALGAELARERKGLGINQTEMADRVGVAQRTLSDIERGINPTLDHYLRYANAVGADFAVLVARARMQVKALLIDESTIS